MNDLSSIIDSLTQAGTNAYALSQGAVVQNGTVTSASVVQQQSTNTTLWFLLIAIVVVVFAFHNS